MRDFETMAAEDVAAAMLLWKAGGRGNPSPYRDS
jgi:hypothetical protein